MTEIGARSATGRTKHGAGWIPWVALLALLVLIAIVVLIIANVSDENDAPGVDVEDDEVRNETVAPPWLEHTAVA